MKEFIINAFLVYILTKLFGIYSLSISWFIFQNLRSQENGLSGSPGVGSKAAFFLPLPGPFFLPGVLGESVPLRPYRKIYYFSKFLNNCRQNQ